MVPIQLTMALSRVIENDESSVDRRQIVLKQ